MSPSQQPQIHDAVLGGQSPIPLGGVILGGLEGTRQRFNSPHLEQRIAALRDFPKYGTDGLQQVVQAMHDSSFIVQKVAYQLVRSHSTTPMLHDALRSFDAYRILDNLHTFSGHAGGITAIAISPNGEFVVSAGRDATLRVWDLPTQQEVMQIREPSFIYAITVHSDERTITIKCHNQTIKAWDLRTQSEIAPDDLPTRAIASVIVSAKPGNANQHRTHKHLVFGSQNTVRIWDLQHGKEIRVLRGHTSLVTAVAANPGQALIASGGEDRTIKIWGIESI